MAYYIFKAAINTPETGSQYPQVQKMSPGYDYKASNSVHALSRFHNDFPQFEPNLDHFVVNGKSNLTDRLSAAVIHGGFLISNKLKLIFEKLNLPQHKFYPAKVLHRKKFYEYHWMHLICNLTEFVDYPKSIFFIYHNFAHNLGRTEISSKEDLVQKERKLQIDNPDKTVNIWAERITLTSNFNKELDLFKIGDFDNNYYASDGLKKQINLANITGCSFEPALNLIV